MTTEPAANEPSIRELQAQILALKEVVALLLSRTIPEAELEGDVMKAQALAADLYRQQGGPDAELGALVYARVETLFAMGINYHLQRPFDPA